MDYYEKFNILKNSYRSEVISSADFISDLSLLLEGIVIRIDELDTKENQVLYPDTYNLSEFDNIKSIEFNNAVMISSMLPKSIRSILQEAFFDKKYGFIYTTCQFISHSNAAMEYKKSVKDFALAIDKLTDIKESRKEKRSYLLLQIIVRNYINNNQRGYKNWFAKAEKFEEFFTRVFLQKSREDLVIWDDI